MTNKYLRLAWLVVVLLLAFGGVAHAQTKTLYWQRYDVDITVQQNGDLRIVETQELVFTQGTYQYGQREISLANMGGISNVSVQEEGGQVYSQAGNDAPYTYRTYQQGNSLYI